MKMMGMAQRKNALLRMGNVAAMAMMQRTSIVMSIAHRLRYVVFMAVFLLVPSLFVMVLTIQVLLLVCKLLFFVAYEDASDAPRGEQCGDAG